MNNLEATQKQTEETTKKTEAKEEGIVSKHITGVYSDKRKRNTFFYALVCLISLIFILFVALSYGFTQPRNPRFMLDDLYVDSVSNSSLMVKLSSTNPSHKTSIHYTKMSLHVWIKGDFETEKVYLESTSQEPRERTTWKAVVDTNKKNVKPGGSFQIRKGITDGEVIADLSIQWKCGIFSWSKCWRLRCPVLLNLEDLTSVVSKPMSSCSHHST